jgi:NAD(P)H-flavin reductase
MASSLKFAGAVAPNDPFAAYVATIRSIHPESRGIDTYALELDDPDARQRYRFQPGQFNMLYLPGIGEAAVSISSDPNRPQTLLHTIRAVGNVTRALGRMRAGDRIFVRGPFGSAWPIADCRGSDLVIAAGGLGLPPLRPAIYEIIRRRGEFGQVSLLYGARTPVDLLFQDEYEGWRDAGIDVRVTVDIGSAAWQGPIGVVPSLLEQVRLDGQRTRLLTCGPEIMMRFVIYEALSRGIAADHAFLSIERNMNCAVGFCGHCQLGPVFVCKEGPVFSFQRMQPFLNVEDF